MTNTIWAPPAEVSRDEILATDADVAARPRIPYSVTEDVFRIEELGLAWDIGVHVYEPDDPTAIPVGPDGKRVGCFLLHGGEDDWREMEPLADLLTGTFGWKVVSGTFPGRLYFPDPSRNWPGDSFRADGTVRTPIWQIGEEITPDQYEIIKDESNRGRDGVRTLARAKPGTTFYYRMAAWPAAMEMGMVEGIRRHLPADEYSVYLHGHSTGGPFVSMLSQRVPNCAGVLAAENSAYGKVNGEKYAWSSVGKVQGYDIPTTAVKVRTDRFNDLYLRTWRDHARYKGAELLATEGPAALMRLPWVIEDILTEWEAGSWTPRFKCEYTVTHNIRPSLIDAAQVTAARLGLSSNEADALEKRFVGYTEPLTGAGVKPVPPFLFGISKDSRDHSPEVYAEVILPMFRAFEPPPKIALCRFMAGVHQIWKPEPGLEMGIVRAVVQQWSDAIDQGWFLP
jgi:hypothetical protein